MKNKILVLALFSILIVSCNPTDDAMPDPGPAEEAEEPLVAVKSPSEANAGEEVVVEIEARDVEDLYAYQFELSYNPEVLEYVSFEEAEFLSQGEETFAVQPEAVDGRVRKIGVTRIGDVSGVDGSGTIATLTFTAREAGESELGLHNVVLLNSDSEMIDASSIGRSIGVT